jgi:transcriptional regulator with XRE-family HTH domain
MAQYTNFGRLVSEKLTNQGFTQEKFSNRINRSVSYLNQTMTGVRKPSAAHVDAIADAFNLNKDERQKLHYLAAMEHGFKLDLTKK